MNALRLFGVYWNQGINGNTSLRYSEFREGAFDFQTLQQNRFYHIEAVVKNSELLADKYNADKEVVMIAAWLHDIIMYT